MAVTGTVVAAPVGVESPSKAVEAFYEELIARKVSGLPQGEAWTALQPRMTEALVASIEAARKEQANFRKAQPDEKPPWIEGDLFSSLFEGPQKFTVGKVEVKKDRAFVSIGFIFESEGETSKWTDTALLRKVGKGWLVDDVFFGGEWAFGRKSTLQDALSPEPSSVSPDGRFEFVAYSIEENNEGKPPFGIVERASGKLVWFSEEDLGDVSRPEEWVLWSPDSKRFALVTRVSTRRLGTFFYGLEGEGFVSLAWKDAGKLELLADAKVVAAGRRDGFTKKAQWGQIIADDTLPVRWLDVNSVVVVRAMDRIVTEEGKDESTASGTARVILRWDAKTRGFLMVGE
ncbi:hypothetical protein FEM03_10195 [Phragmitibacter flavus]|uniref:DUF3828 domain-containing protein n=2 Tax=Phragmitibacter flavus TaxID=2576071 RepID=A0A5R8KED9_9BACT|nr:hypothetical protein FEM03_10195 [Phragmitibacter flavus]